ncbi:hypothetical protein BDQ17DRAFT_1322905 [Cyathus striatus]|nr:hypothetical protein BDQ17DRAFT_1322905 [Cyathus striatus]
MTRTKYEPGVGRPVKAAWSLRCNGDVASIGPAGEPGSNGGDWPLINKEVKIKADLLLKNLILELLELLELGDLELVLEKHLGAVRWLVRLGRVVLWGTGRRGGLAVDALDVLHEICEHAHGERACRERMRGGRGGRGKGKERHWDWHGHGDGRGVVVGGGVGGGLRKKEEVFVLLVLLLVVLVLVLVVLLVLSWLSLLLLVVHVGDSGHWAARTSKGDNTHTSTHYFNHKLSISGIPPIFYLKITCKWQSHRNSSTNYLTDMTRKLSADPPKDAELHDRMVMSLLGTTVALVQTYRYAKTLITDVVVAVLRRGNRLPDCRNSVASASVLATRQTLDDYFFSALFLNSLSISPMELDMPELRSVHHVENIDSDPQEPPTRPSTPLGFSRSDELQLYGVSHDAALPADTPNFRSLSDQLPIRDASNASTNAGDNNLISDTSSASVPSIFTHSPDDIDAISGPAHHRRLNLADSHENCGDTLSSSDNDEVDSEIFESDCSSCDSSDEEISVCSIPPSPPMTPPPSRSVSRLSFPFCKRKLRPRVSVPPALRRAPPPPPPPPVRRFSCLPSPLSPNRTLTRPDCPPTAPTRHNYEEHGYSRHGFLYLKQFWFIREEDWDLKAPRAEDSRSASGGTPDVLCLSKLGPSFRMSKKARLRVDLDDALPLPTIHPRRGDISALRNPWCADVDLCFAALPVWTISKTLWMYDLHVEVNRRAKAEEADDDTESEADTSMSTGYSDDSDVTLVESESESNLKHLSSRIQSREIIGDDEKVSTSYSPPGESSTCPFTQSLTGKHLLSTTNSESSLYCGLSCSPPSPVPRWTTDWYGRWELIRELTCRDQERKLAEHTQVQTAGTSAAKGSRFFIASA